MKKADLVDVVAQQKNLPRQQVEITIDALIEAVAEGLAKGERIDLRGFGAFAVRESAARTGRNPQTGAPSRSRRAGTDVQSRQGAPRPGESPRFVSKASSTVSPAIRQYGSTDGYSTFHRQSLVHVTEQELREAFTGEGIELRSVRVALDRETGRPRGFAFVETMTDEGAKASIEKLSGRVLQGRAIIVEEAQAKPAGPRPGGFGGPPRPGGAAGFGGPALQVARA